MVGFQGNQKCWMCRTLETRASDAEKCSDCLRLGVGKQACLTFSDSQNQDARAACLKCSSQTYRLTYYNTQFFRAPGYTTHYSCHLLETCTDCNVIRLVVWMVGFTETLTFCKVIDAGPNKCNLAKKTLFFAPHLLIGWLLCCVDPFHYWLLFLSRVSALTSYMYVHRTKTLNVHPTQPAKTGATPKP